MSLGLTLRVSQRLEHRIEQMMKLELRQELRILLRQILELLQSLRSQKLSLKQIDTIRSVASTVDQTDAHDLCHEIVRRGGVRATLELVQIMEFVHFRDHDHPDARALANFNDLLQTTAYREMHRREQGQAAGQAIGLALRFVLREPQFWEGRPGTKEELLSLIDSVPQSGSRGEVIWALAGGWAVEILTGHARREHHDIDTLILLKGRAMLADTDMVHTDDYFGVLSCTSEFVRRNCLTMVNWEAEERIVWVLCPEFLFLSKFLKSDREKDWQDIGTLVEVFGATFDLGLIRKLLKRKACRFPYDRELMAILTKRDPAGMMSELLALWTSKDED